jgi:glycosyltransferase involved in cell wall biosynthesis
LSQLNDAPGRPTFEAAFFGIPSVVAVSKPIEDNLINGFTGIAVPPKNPAELAEAIMFYFQNPKIRAEAGINARHLANKNFNSKRILSRSMTCT